VRNGGKITVAGTTVLTLAIKSGTREELDLSAGGSIEFLGAGVLKFTHGNGGGLAASLKLSGTKSIQGIDTTGTAFGVVAGDIVASSDNMAIANNIAGSKAGSFANATQNGTTAIGSACIVATIASNDGVLTAPAGGATISKDSLILTAS
jgi:hypothetical protein